MFLREWYVKRKLKELKRNSPQSILDAGCGFGQYSYFIAKKFRDAKITSVDVKEDYIEDCRYFFEKLKITNCKFSAGDLTKLNESDRYDLILSVDVMEHIDDDIGVFRNFYKALNNNGRVIINTPSNLGGSDTDSNSGESFIGEHVRTGYSKDDIISKLESAGFKIESFDYTYGKWGKLYWKLGIKYPMLMLNASKIFFLILPFYYLFTIWWVLLFMKLDIMDKNKKEGTGVLVVAQK